MGHTYRRGGDKKYFDDYNAYSESEKKYRNHKEEKRINAALKLRDVRALSQEDEDEEDY